MTSRFSRLLIDTTLAAGVVGIFILTATNIAPQEQTPAPQVAATPAAFLPDPTVAHLTPLSPTTTTSSATSSDPTPPTPRATSTPVKVSAPTPVSSPITAPPLAPNQVMRIERPYDIPVKTVEAVNATARASTVHILCESENGLIKPISGSGVIIDSRGVVLTNAHIGQYVLLSTDPAFRISCVIRTGSPATRAWTVEPLFIPRQWIESHATDIVNEHSKGTGEHDFALLRVAGSAGKPLPSSFPALPYDTRDAIGFVGDQILLASYPAEFVGGFAARNDLYAVTSVTTVKNLMTFTQTAIDMISLGGVIGAQGGSSGGSIVNAWGYLIGVITTTTEGATTADRDLRAITLAHIDRDMRLFTGNSLTEFLGRDLTAIQDDFTRNTAPSLLSFYRQFAQ